MTAEQQLERSVLEGKERDELSAIAQAMSLKTTSRTKKADIIDQILDATGVTSGPTASANGDGGGQRGGQADPAVPRHGRSAADGHRATADGDRRRGQRRRGRAPRPSRRRATRAPPADEPPRRPPTTAEAAGAGDSGPAVFVEPPELADGADPGPRQNGQGQNQQDRNRSNQNNQQPEQPEPRQPGRRRCRQPAQPPPPRPRAWPGGRAPGRRRPGAALHRRDGRGEGPARPARRGLRLPALRRLPALVQGRVRLHQPGPAVRPAQGRLRRGRLPAGLEQREVPGPAAHRHRLGPRPRGGPQPPPLRGPHPAVPRLAAQPRDGRATRTT